MVSPKKKKPETPDKTEEKIKQKNLETSQFMQESQLINSKIGKKNHGLEVSKLTNSKKVEDKRDDKPPDWGYAMDSSYQFHDAVKKGNSYIEKNPLMKESKRVSLPGEKSSISKKVDDKRDDQVPDWNFAMDGLGDVQGALKKEIIPPSVKTDLKESDRKISPEKSAPKIPETPPKEEKEEDNNGWGF